MKCPKCGKELCHAHGKMIYECINCHKYFDPETMEEYKP